MTTEHRRRTLSTRGDEREPQEVGGEPVGVGVARPQVAGAMLHTQPIKSLRNGYSVKGMRKYLRGSDLGETLTFLTAAAPSSSLDAAAGARVDGPASESDKRRF